MFISCLLYLISITLPVHSERIGQLLSWEVDIGTFRLGHLTFHVS